MLLKQIKQLLTSLVESTKALHERVGQMVTKQEFDAKLTALIAAVTGLIGKINTHPAATDFTDEAAAVQSSLDAIAASGTPDPAPVAAAPADQSGTPAAQTSTAAPNPAAQS
jgi:hypothetical protein